MTAPALSERISLTPDEASALTGIPKKAIQAAYLSGELPAYYRSPRRPVLLPEDLRDWIKSAPTERASA